VKLGLKTTSHMLAAAVMAAFAGGAAAQSVTYENTVKKILAERCIMCHGTGAPSLAEFSKDQEGWKKKMKGPRVDTYPDLMLLVKGSDAGAFMRRLDDGKNTKDGKPGNMYVYLGSNDAERAQRLDTLKKWVGNWSLKRRKELSDADLRTITAAEK
jgi:mono/diheme cytochrome c family protein